MPHDNITDIYTYLRAHAAELGSRILETYPPLQSTKDPIAPRLATLLRKALPAQALAITGTAKYLQTAKAARIVAECGAGKTLMALGTIHVVTDGRPSATLVMCPLHITHKWAREALQTIPQARTFLIEDMRNGGDGVSLFYNPDFVETLSAATLAGTLAHEVMHPALCHHTRRAGRAFRRWNEACDYAINPLLLDAGLKLPVGVLVDERFRGLSAEEILVQLDGPQSSCKTGNDTKSQAQSPGRPSSKWSFLPRYRL